MATFCLIHGRWHDGSCWGSVADRLRALGHDAIAPDMPFDDPRADYEQRARPALQALEGVDDPVVVVGHSAGSAEAAMVAQQRHAALVVYVCGRFGSFPAPPDAPSPFRTGFPFPRSDAGGLSVWEPEAAIAAMYGRLPPATARELASRLLPGADAVGEYPLDRHPDVPAALIYTTDDELFTPEWERFIALHLLGVEPIAIPGGHFPMIEDPDTLADLLGRLASDQAGGASTTTT